MIGIFSWSPNPHSEENSISKTTIKELGEKVKHLSECKGGIKVLDDISGSSKSYYVDQFFMRGRHNSSVFYYPSQSFLISENKL